MVRQVRRAVGQLQSRSTRRCATPACTTMSRQDRLRSSTPGRCDRGDVAQARPASTPSWCRAASASAASRARSPPRAMRAGMTCPTWASASGMQVATIEYRAPRWLGLERRQLDRVRPRPAPVIALIDRVAETPTAASRSATPSSDLGGTMRLGARELRTWQPGTLAHAIYGDVVTGRHRHRLRGQRSTWTACAQAAAGDLGARPQRSGTRPRSSGCRRPVHPGIVGVQFHPEFKSRRWTAIPLFNAFVKGRPGPAASNFRQRP